MKTKGRFGKTPGYRGMYMKTQVLIRIIRECC